MIPTENPTSASEQVTPVVSPSTATSPSISRSFDEDNIDEFLTKIDAAIATTKEEVKKTTINSKWV